MVELDKPAISALEEYISTQSRDSWNTLYTLIYNCISNMAKKEYHGVYNSNLEDRVSDATYIMMLKIKEYPHFKEGMLHDLKTSKTRHLTSYCYWPMISQLRGRKQIKEDTEYSYDYILEYNKKLEEEHEHS